MGAVTLLLVLFLTSCAGIFDGPFKPEFHRPNPQIYRVNVPDEATMNAMCQDPLGLRKRLGCAYIPPDPEGLCVIVLYANSDEDTVEHEINHCKYGRFHP